MHAIWTMLTTLTMLTAVVVFSTTFTTRELAGAPVSSVVGAVADLVAVAAVRWHAVSFLRTELCLGEPACMWAACRALQLSYLSSLQI